jgi:hypothetical protein
MFDYIHGRYDDGSSEVVDHYLYLDGVWSLIVRLNPSLLRCIILLDDGLL